MTKDEERKCEFCDLYYKKLGEHIRKIHKISCKEYYDEFYKKEEGVCLVCGENTKFVELKKGYMQYCSRKCMYKSDKRNSQISAHMTKFYKTDAGEQYKKMLSDTRMGENNPVHKQTQETRDRMSENNSAKMKQRILNGDFTPKATNSWANSYCRIPISDYEFRSTWEAVFFILNPHLQYEKLRIPYIDEHGKRRIYIVDFIDYDKKIVFEVKPSKERNKQNNILKENSLKNWCNMNNFVYNVVDDDFFKENASKIDYNKFDPKLKKGMKQFL